MSEIGLLEKRIMQIFNTRKVPLSVTQAKALIWKIIEDMAKDFPILEAGSFSKLPDGTIINYYIKEVLDWRNRWLTPKEKCKHENLRTPKVDGKYLWEFKECLKCGEVFHT